METEVLKDRIVEFKRVKASDLIPNEKNWRKHSNKQRDILSGVMQEVGFAGAVLTRQTDRGYEIIDGHLRTDEAGDNEVPILVTNLNQEESDKLLAVYDPITALAEMDEEAYAELTEGMQFENDFVNNYLELLKEESVSWDMEETFDSVENTEETDEGIVVRIVLNCPQSLKDSFMESLQEFLLDHDYIELF